MKIEMCQQSSEAIKLDKLPFYGMGVASVVTSFSNTAKTKMQEQIYELNIAINTNFIVYMNRLKALEQFDSYNTIMTAVRSKTGGVWDLYFDYRQKEHTDEILVRSFERLKLLWRLYYQIESLLDSRLLKFWSFRYSNNVCRLGAAYDISAFGNNFLCIIALIVMSMAAWMNEYIVRCIIYEESRFLNIEKYRHDWI